MLALSTLASSNIDIAFDYRQSTTDCYWANSVPRTPLRFRLRNSTRNKTIGHELRGSGSSELVPGAMSRPPPSFMRTSRLCLPYQPHRLVTYARVAQSLADPENAFQRRAGGVIRQRVNRWRGCNMDERSVVMKTTSRPRHKTSLSGRRAERDVWLPEVAQHTQSASYRQRHGTSIFQLRDATVRPSWH